MTTKRRTTQTKLPKRDTLPVRWRIALAERGWPVTRNDRRLHALTNKHAGQVGFLIGNGPSVRPADLDRLEHAVTFCCNRFHLAHEMTRMRATYTFSADQTMIDDFGDDMVSQSAGTVILVSNETLETRGDFIQLRWDDRSREAFRFSERPHHHVWMGGGTLFPAIQVGYFMGIRHFYLYGVDHSFKLEIDEDETDPYRKARGDSNHFIPNYRSGKGWSPPQTDHIERSFQSCDLFMRCRGGWIKNATRGGKLEVLERADFDRIDPAAAPQAEPHAELVNAGFHEWRDGKPAGWDCNGAVADLTGERIGDGSVVEIQPADAQPSGHPHLHQRVRVDETARGGRIRVSLDGHCAQKNLLFLKLDVTAGGEKTVHTVNHPGHGTWEPLILDADLPPDTDLGELHLSIGIRKETPGRAQLANLRAGLRPG
jgi:hypothetical protein